MGILAVVLSFFAGAFILFAYMVKRMIDGEGWDKSNMTNALRLIAHAVVHPGDFGKMYYLTEDAKALLQENGIEPRKPFYYYDKDELSEVVNTRPLPNEK